MAKKVAQEKKGELKRKRIDKIEEVDVLIREEIKAKKSGVKKDKQQYKRIILVHNPRSSGAGLVEMEVIDEARKLKGYVVAKYAVQQIGVEKNAKSLAKLLSDGDLVISAGGDGTALIALNGVMLSKKDVNFAVLPYGNFNDMSRIGGVKTLNQAIKGKTREVWPLEVRVNGKFWRYVMCYATTGMLARSVQIFEEKGLRKDLQAKKGNIVGSLVSLAVWWFKNREKRFLPKFLLNNWAVEKGATDYMAVNSKTVAKIMKNNGAYKDKEIFRSGVEKLSGFGGLAWFMARSLNGKMPLYESKLDKLTFDKPTKIDIQAEGEYAKLEGVTEIVVKKANSAINLVKKG